MSDITIEAHGAAVQIQARLMQLNGDVPDCVYPDTDYLAAIILAAFRKAQQKPAHQTFLVVGSQRSYEDWLIRFYRASEQEGSKCVVRISSVAEVDGYDPSPNVFVVDCPDANLAALQELERRGFHILPFE